MTIIIPAYDYCQREKSETVEKFKFRNRSDLMAAQLEKFRLLSKMGMALEYNLDCNDFTEPKIFSLRIIGHLTGRQTSHKTVNSLKIPKFKWH